MPKGFVISDLHLFAERSRADELLEDIHQHSAGSDFCVLNGDIVDFRWSQHRDIDKTIDSALQWLSELVVKNSNCHYYYVLGNHDDLAPFVYQLDTINQNNFSWHPTHLIVEDSLFLHGDLSLSGLNPFERKYRDDHKISGKFAEKAYSAVIKSRLHRLIYNIHGKKKSSKVIYNSIKKHNPAILEEISHIYFGHTHVPFNDHHHNGVYFHNTGSAIKNVKTNIITMQYGTGQEG